MTVEKPDHIPDLFGGSNTGPDDLLNLIATRDRMLQLSQERNIYTKKIIYILLSVIISILIITISLFRLYNKK